MTIVKSINKILIQLSNAPTWALYVFIAVITFFGTIGQFVENGFDIWTLCSAITASFTVGIILALVYYSAKLGYGICKVKDV